MAIFQRPTGCVNITPFAAAPFQRLRTPTHALTHALIFLMWLKVQGSTTIQREVFAP